MAQIAVSAGLAVVTTAAAHYLFPNEAPPDAYDGGQRVGESRITNGSHGAVIPTIYGRFAVAPQVLAVSGVRTVEREESVGKGDFFGGGGSLTKKSSYQSLAICVCQEVPGHAVRWKKIVANSTVIWRRDPAYRHPAVRAPWIQEGFYTTAPNPLLETLFGDGEVPAYRLRSYAVLEDFPLSTFGNSVPNFSVEIENEPFD